MPAAAPPPARGEPRDVRELRALKAAQPELADAVDLQLALLEIHRRVQGRIPLPSVDMTASRVADHSSARRVLVAFADIPLDVGDLRLVLRQTAEVLHRFGLLDEGEHGACQRLARDGDVRAAAEAWFAGSAARAAGRAVPGGDADQVWPLVLRPFLARCADAVQPTAGLEAWTAGCCPVCGGEPELGILERSGRRQLVCGQCALRWTFAAERCPFCDPGRPPRLTAFTTVDRMYQVTACEDCRRYLKSFCSHRAARPVLPAVEGLATLALDAAAQQRGYTDR